MPPRMRNLYRSGGGLQDPWGHNPSIFSERKKVYLRYKNLEVNEPCNFASNIAYYHMAQGVCEYRDWALPRESVEALVESSAGLALGSSFYHGSHTRLGQVLDNFMISVISYNVHQASLSGLGYLSPELTDLTSRRRRLSAAQISKKMVYMFKEEPVHNWLQITKSVDVPDYAVSFSATISTLLTVVFPHSLSRSLVPTLSDLFGVPEESKRFITYQYLPKLRTRLKTVNISFFQKVKLFLQTLSALSKLVYGFLWQEDVFKIKWLTQNPAAVTTGSVMAGKVNLVSSLLGWMPVLSTPLATTRGVYPGEGWCKLSQPHALWHTESAAGLLDYYLVADSFYRYSRQY